MRRNILFVTTDQQRFDALGCNGGAVARTPVVDGLAARGINYRRAYNQNTVCMPARSTILTGQYARTHGVVANGVPLPCDAPSVAAWLSERAGYRTALVGKAHFEPAFDPRGQYEENARWMRGDTGPWRGFDHSVQAVHVAAFRGRPIAHYGAWLAEHHPEHLDSFSPLLGAEPGGDTLAPETKQNPIPRGWYHTDWVADRTIGWLEDRADDDPWFCWMSFPDPHHPWDPPEEEMRRVDWRDLDLPAGHPGTADAVRAVLAGKPPHWLAWWEGSFLNAEGGPMFFCPGALTHDQIREVNARTHVMNELIDEAVGRVLGAIERRGWSDRTDVFFTTDHGELQGDFGLLFKGPFHTDALMRLPMVWMPAPVAGVAPAVVADPVGQLDLAPTFCAIAGIEPAPWMQGRALPLRDGEAGHERVLCEWGSQFPGYGMHLRTIYRDGWLCTAYEASTDGEPNGLEKRWGEQVLAPCGIHYDGTEGELYRVDDDPFQFDNLWDDAGYRSVRDDLVADLYESLPAERRILEVEAPA
jgi:arylsulfatase A-like enzyme